MHTTEVNLSDLLVFVLFNVCQQQLSSKFLLLKFPNMTNSKPSGLVPVPNCVNLPKENYEKRPVKLNHSTQKQR